MKRQTAFVDGCMQAKNRSTTRTCTETARATKMERKAGRTKEQSAVDSLFAFRRGRRSEQTKPDQIQPRARFPSKPARQPLTYCWAPSQRWRFSQPSLERRKDATQVLKREGERSRTPMGPTSRLVALASPVRVYCVPFVRA